MEPFDGGQFEREWASALESAEITPSAALWDQIDMNLSGQEGIVYRKRFVAMRWVAAAAVILALFAGAIGYYFYDTSEQLKNTLALQERSSTDIDSPQVPNLEEQNLGIMSSPETLDGKEEEDEEQALPINNTVDPNTDHVLNHPSDNKPTNSTPIANNHQISRDKMVADSYSNINLVLGNNSTKDKNSFLGSIISFNGVAEETQLTLLPTVGFGFTGLSFKSVEMEKVPFVDIEEVSEDAEGTLWAGLNFSGGAYNPESSGLSLGLSAQEDAALNVGNSGSQESLIRGNTRGYGVGFGTSLNEKLILVGGFQYASVTSGKYLGTDSQVAANKLDVTRSNFNSSVATNSALIIDTYNFFSIPLEAGYNLLDGRFSLSLNSGIDTRIYLNRNTERLVSGTPDQDALFTELNPFTFWGQLSTDISYKLSDHYRIVVSPGYKISINSFEKGSNIHPALRELTFSMRYVFGKD